MAASPGSPLSYTAARDALGLAEPMGTYVDEVALDSIVGTLAREADYDETFTPRRPDARWHRAKAMLAAGQHPPPVDLVRLGDLYFVSDGHRRVSVARAAGHAVVPARVTRHCTVAYALCCLRAEHLASKAAERRFLERIPLADEVRKQLWLDRPADWARLADHVHSWGFTHAGSHDVADANDLAAAWWTLEVEPVLDRLRSRGLGHRLRDIQLYVAALAARDHLGDLDWPTPMTCTGSCCTDDERPATA